MKNTSVFNKKYEIGILGAGQLGTFLADACEKHHVSSWCLFYEKDDDPGFLKYKKNSQKISIDQKKRIQQLNQCQTIILESEFFAWDELSKVEADFLPSLDSYKHFYGKINQRKFYSDLKLNSPNYWILSDVSDLDNINTFPLILKRNLFSYDGNGNRECKNLHELHRYAIELGLPLLAEEKLDLESEFAVGIVANSKTGEWLNLPLIETFQKNHICHYVIGPYSLNSDLKSKLDIEIDKLKKANLHGLFAFEFFITKNQEIIINEGAARPHNSQHLTMNLCEHSQFDYLIELALNQKKLSDVVLKSNSGAMINLLGKKNQTNPVLSLPKINQEYPFEVFMYGKTEGRIGRKLGHINILDLKNNKNEFTKLLDHIYEDYEL
jgi:5-(carboxyamino)imidazole ribonucleotide synthase